MKKTYNKYELLQTRFSRILTIDKETNTVQKRKQLEEAAKRKQKRKRKHKKRKRKQLKETEEETAEDETAEEEAAEKETAEEEGYKRGNS